MESIALFTLSHAIGIYWACRIFKHAYRKQQIAYIDVMNRLNHLYTWSTLVARQPEAFTITDCATLINALITFESSFTLTYRDRRIVRSIIQDVVNSMAHSLPHGKR